MNGHSCARVQTTTSNGGSAFNAHQIGIYYFDGYCSIFNQYLTTLPVETQFQVVLDLQQTIECSDVIFANGFD